MLRTTVILFLLTGLVSDLLSQSKGESTIQRYDSVIVKKLSKIDSVETLTNRIESVKPLKNKVDRLEDSRRSMKYNQKFDSVKGKLTHRIDSLQSLKLPTDKYTILLDSLQKSGSIKNIKEAKAKLFVLQKKLNEPVNKLNQSIGSIEGKINSKLSELNKEGMGLPIDVGLKDSKLQLPNDQLPNANMNSPIGSKLNNIQKPNSDNIAGLGSVNKELQSITDVPKKELIELKNNAGDLTGIQNELKDVNQLGKEVKGYTQDVKNISTGDFEKAKQLPQTIETEVSKLEGVKELQGEVKGFEQYQSMLGKAKGPKQIEQLAIKQTKEAVNHFAGKEQALLSAIDQVNKFKIKYPTTASIKDLTKPVRNAMYGRPFIERVVPGITLQMQTKGDVLIDFNPLIGYRLSGKWTAGLGWVERVQFQHLFTTVPSGRVYGIRSFTDIKWKKGISLRAEVERISSYVPSLQSTQLPEGSRVWQWGIFAGLKKDYQFLKGVKGNFQILYNVNQYIQNASPYVDKVNVRMGFEFPLRKTKKLDN